MRAGQLSRVAVVADSFKSQLWSWDLKMCRKVLDLGGWSSMEWDLEMCPCWLE